MSGGGLVLDDVTVRYGEVVAVDHLDLHVTEGEVVALLGPSGCGKSSVLRAVAGLEPLAGGSVRFGGRDLAGVPVHRRQLGLMFQDHALFPTLDVAGNVAFGLRRQGWPRDRVEARVRELLALVGLAGYGGRPVTALSGGEAQRVALARALAPRPRLLMLDEPLGALDRNLREQLTRDLRRVLADVGQTALHVTHDQAEAFAVADRVAVLRAGRILRIGAPADVWTDPGDAFTARFLGHPNVWEVVVDERGVARWLDVPLGRLGPSVPPGPVSIVVPPSAVHVDPLGVIDGRVTEVVVREDRWRTTVETAGGPVALVADAPPPVGAAVRLRVDLDPGARPITRSRTV